MSIEIKASTREAQGTSASRRLRKAGRLPGIVYGGGDVTLLELDHNEIYYKLENEAFHASVLSLDVNGKAEQVMLRDFSMHPFRQQVMHIDFQRVDINKKLHTKVPLHFLNADIAPGVKTGGGKISLIVNELEIACLPKDLPIFIEVDLSAMNLGESMHVGDITLPAGVEAVAHGREVAKDVVASMQNPRGGAAVGEEEDAAAE